MFIGAYPDTHRDDIIKIQEIQMTENDRNKVVNNIFKARITYHIQKT